MRGCRRAPASVVRDEAIAAQLARTSVEVEEFVVAIDAATVEKLRSLWDLALMQVRPSSDLAPPTDADGYYFADCGKHGCLAGAAESPARESKPGRLVQVGRQMCELARCTGAACADVRKVLMSKVDDLLRDYSEERKIAPLPSPKE